ncbi:AAA-domain-containing protein [Pyrenochaeta sp. DS3sAY3a]|nr:AAA-domain-containing protein [Pyrenochaeta sp. DS3sAY3a]
MRAASTQKAYDEAFLACSTAVYFESQNNEKEALRSWKTALDHIYYHNARRNPSTYRPSSETDRALIDSLRQLELQCKERVDLLEALKQSREESKESLTSSSSNSKAPMPPPHTVPVSSTETDGTSSWLGGGSIPPLDYTDLSRPPPLPYRPAMAPRKSSGGASLTQVRSASTLSPGVPPEKKSRTPSPEKKSRMLRTLRPHKDSKPSKLQSSLRSRPEASRAATQAWSVKTAPGCSKPSVNTSTPSAPSLLASASARSSLDRPASERPSTQYSYQDSLQPQAPFYFRAGDGAASTAYSVPASNSGNSTEPPKFSAAEKIAPPIPRKSVDLSKLPALQGNSTALPSYRKEFPTPMPDARSLAASAAARSYNDYGPEKTVPSWDPSTRRLVHQPARNTARARPSQQRDSPEPDSLEDEEEEIVKPRPPQTRKGRARGDSMRADLPPTTTSDTAESDQELEESDEWKRRTEEIMKNLPRGVDKQAAQQILNEIVIQGDEVHWDDVAGLEIAKSALKETVVYPFLRPDLFMGLREPARGMLLFGPPGTGKTMLARAVATESKSTFFAISASSLTSKFLGESEKLVRALFQLAKLLAPSIIFVDEIDSLLSSRSGSGEHEATRRIKTEFLIQWSDLQKAAAGRDLSEKDKEKGDATRVLVLAATNLPWAIDEAARRRFVRRQYIPLPEDWVRKQQVKTLLSHQKHELSDRDLDKVVLLTEGFSGSDITALAKDAAMGPLRSLGEKLLSMTMDQIRPIEYEDFLASLQTIRPSVSKQGLKEFEEWAKEYGERGG